MHGQVLLSEATSWRTISEPGKWQLRWSVVVPCAEAARHPLPGARQAQERCVGRQGAPCIDCSQQHIRWNQLGLQTVMRKRAPHRCQ